MADDFLSTLSAPDQPQLQQEDESEIIFGKSKVRIQEEQENIIVNYARPPLTEPLDTAPLLVPKVTSAQELKAHTERLIRGISRLI